MTEKQVEHLPEQTSTKGKPGVKKTAAARTIGSGLMADVKQLIQRLRRRGKT